MAFRASGETWQKLMIPSLHTRATCNEPQQSISLLPHLLFTVYVYKNSTPTLCASPVCRESSCNNVQPGASPRQLRRLTAWLYWSRRTGKFPASVRTLVIMSSVICELISYLSARPNAHTIRWGTGSDRRARTNMRAVVLASVRVSDHSPLLHGGSELSSSWGRARLTWRQGAKSSPLAMMHLW